MKRCLFALALFYGLNGVWMLAAPHLWFTTIPGVEDTGPFNAHLVRDTGLGFMAAAAALCFVPARPRDGRGFGLVACLFLLGHAGVHLAEFVVHEMPLSAVLRDTVLILLPAGFLLAAMARRRRHA